MTLIWRWEIKVILDEYEVRIVECNYEVRIHYPDIKVVRLGTDVLVIEGGDRDSTHEFWTGIFNSDEEASRFVEELKRRVEQAKSSTSN